MSHSITIACRTTGSRSIPNVLHMVSIAFRMSTFDLCFGGNVTIFSLMGVVESMEDHVMVWGEGGVVIRALSGGIMHLHLVLRVIKSSFLLLSDL